jgi:N-methylhydantoinase A
VPADRRNIKPAIDLRYAGQAYELTVPFDKAAEKTTVEDLAAEFTRAHRDRYGYVVDGEDIQITAVRTEAFETMRFDEREAPDGARSLPEPVEHRAIHDIYEMKAYRTPVYNKTALPPEVEIAGPCVIEQMDTTIHVLRGQRAVVDKFANVIISAG